MTESTPEPINAADVLGRAGCRWDAELDAEQDPRDDGPYLNAYQLAALLAHGNGATEGPVVTIHADGTLRPWEAPSLRVDERRVLEAADESLADWVVSGDGAAGLAYLLQSLRLIIDRLTEEAT